MSITEFLLARIDEDEERNNPAPDPSASCDYLHGVHYDSARVLAECAAKRAIIEQAEEASSDRSQVIGEFCVGQDERDREYATDPGTLILESLAAVYADNPDYQPEWNSRDNTPTRGR